ncbi:VENN motif pre-toxin domain-containing protein [Rodentibacter sp. Ppn85]|uniref:VENN motif pre-toxin domain-containing protein n=1 Tax=Rodentibacter sp. Ppn85 TaxID=1908525 RepID=UPI00098747C3|nr:VENN motif pre-toxin domain-containing protein [Rodentibacter sp. Ppn85]OOF63187.1 hypothetical protein BKL51_08855 [Rodentibacter sp. Ppn85]
MLKEQQALSQAIGNIAEATSRYSELQAQRLEKEAADAQQQGDSQTAKSKQEEAKKWQTGGEHKRKVEALTNAVSLALAGKSSEAVAAGAASPYINEQIKKVTETMPGLNIPAHILWGAIEAELAGGKAATGAIAAGVGEASAGILAEGMYGKSPNELTEEEKQNILTLSKVAAGVASGLTATGNSAENLATISTGITIAENAVEHNFFDVDPHQDRLDDIKLFARVYFNGDEEKAEAYYDAMQQGKAKGFKDNVVETTEAILNLDETIKSLAYAVTHPNEVIDKVYVSMDEWNQQYEYAVKHDPALAGEMQGYIVGNFGSTPVGGLVVGAAGAKLLQKSVALVKKGVAKTGVLPNWANANSKLPIIGKIEGYEVNNAVINGVSVKINDFKGATSESLNRFNNFLSDSVDTTKGSGIRNATKPKDVLIETDWSVLVSEAIDVKIYGNGRRVAIFKDGEKAIFRPSTTGPITIELQRPDSKKIIEVRYER